MHHQRGHYLLGAASPFDRFYGMLGNRRFEYKDASIETKKIVSKYFSTSGCTLFSTW